MYCISCGTQLPDDATFCLKCGTPQGAGVQARTGVPQWETCEILWEETGYDWSRFSNTIRFWVQRIGPDGTKTIAATERLAAPSPNIGLKKTQQMLYDAVDQLKAKLLSDGWEPTGQGIPWYSLTFRRRFK